MRHEVVNIPHGWAGTRATVETAWRLVNDSLRDPVVVETAHDIVRHLPERDKLAEARAVSEFVRRHIRYTNEGIETLKTPRLMIDEIREKGKAVGDCDDHVILWAALHKVLGNPVRFRVISQRPDKYANHIYGEVFIPRHGWVADELIVKDRPLGWKIPAGEITKSMVFLGGLNLGGYTTMSDMEEIFPGGAFLASRAELLPPSARLAVDPFAATAYRLKHGGAAIAEEGGGVGFIPAAITAAAPAAKSVAKVLRKAKKKKKAKASVKEQPAEPELPPPQQEEKKEKGGIGPLPWAALGVLAVFAFLSFIKR
jgi:hypothetical protein